VSDGPLIVQSDKTLLLDIDHPLSDECRRAIAAFAELEKSPEHIHTYRLTPLGLWNARAAGHDAEQVVVNSPDVKPPKQDNSPMAQFQTTIWYGLMSLIGTYFIFSAYQFGTKGLGSSVVGIVFAIIVFLSTVKLALADSALGPAGLIGFVIGIAAVQIFWVFAISLFAPDFINFNWSSIPPPPIPEITGTEV